MERIRSHPVLKKAVENWLTTSNVFLKGYRRLEEFHQADLFEVRRSQEDNVFAQVVRDLFKGREGQSINVSKSFRFTNEIVHDDDSLAFVVSRKDMRRIEKAFHEARVGEGVGGTPKPHDAFGSVGGFYSLTLMGRDRISEETPIVRAVFPRDLVEVKDGSIIAIDSHALVKISNDGRIGRLNHELVAFPHSIRTNSDGSRAVITNSGTDSIMVIDTDILQVVDSWRAYDYGFNLSIGSEQRRFVTYKDKYDPKKVPDGFEVVLVDRAKPNCFPPALQTTHLNSAIFDPRDEQKILMTLFAHKKTTKAGEIIQQDGTGGKVLRVGLDLSGDDCEILVDGLNNPHDLTYLGDGLFMLANTSNGELQFWEDQSSHEWSLFGKLVFDDGLVESQLREHPWIMGVNFTRSLDGNRQFLSIDDSQRKVIHVLEFNQVLRERRRWSIQYPYEWGIQNVWYVAKE